MLTQEHAESRGLVIERGTIHYNLHLCLQKGQNYSGYNEITFTLLTLPNELAIDFSGKTVQHVVSNGQTIQPKVQDGFIYLDVSKLTVGKNIIGITYACTYDNDGQGCVSFVDVDTKQYIYTQFEPYCANRVFPCLDQPNLKAVMQLQVITPSDWKKVLGNETATTEENFNAQVYVQKSAVAYPQDLQNYLKGKEGRMTLFPNTKLLPSYLFCVIAGQYLEYKLENTYNNIPMSLYSIQSLYQHLKILAPFIYEITIESMKFFDQFFGYKFAFNKYDQVFAHQYKWGAMENAGVVTFNDLYVFKEKVSIDRMLSFANTISHQLAHHWFGNLVTMQWWDDLWLNQSFADFISHFCLEKIKNNCKTINYESCMAAFLNRKGWGYHQDQMITTHPIRSPVINTSVAESIFDGITYSKGAACMKQILYLMTQERFSKALGTYFHKYEWSNATIDDFLAQMQTHFAIQEFSLVEWRQQWLDKASHNVIQAQWNPEDASANPKLIVHQTPYTQDHPTLRFNKIKVGLFKQNLQIDVIQVLLRPQPQTVAHYDGSKNYKAVLLNFQDHTFVKNIIDKHSLQFFTKNINNIKDIVSRTLIWRSFFDMIKDGKIRTQQFVDVVVNRLANEQSDSIFEKQFDFISSSIGTYTPIPLRQKLNDSMFSFIYNLIPKIPKEQQNRIVILKSKLPNFASSAANKRVMLNWRQGKDQVLKDFPMSIGQKWSAVVKAFTLKDLSSQEKQAIFESLRVEDPSDTAKNKRFTCDALKSSEQQFQEIYQSFKNPETKNSIAVKRHIAAGWNHPNHTQRLNKYVDRYFEDVQKLVSVLSNQHFEIFYETLQPIGDNLDYYISRYEKIVFPEGKQKHSREILKIVDDLKRRRNAYKLYENAQPAL